MTSIFIGSPSRFLGKRKDLSCDLPHPIPRRVRFWSRYILRRTC